ncbi:MAG: hypothetical protein RO469_05970 [Thermincola sp.]|nr:hypothetical protein [Thermincola sp.]MDT3702835.1 hypothetical protein [Thermincola sp.]
MKKVIFPVVCAVIMIIAVKLLNPDLEATGYVIAAGLGLFIGSFINKLVFKKEDVEKSEMDSVAK